MSSLLLNKLKCGIENNTEVTLKVLSNAVSDENIFWRKLLLTNTQVLRLLKAFVNDSSANIKLSKPLLQKVGQSGGFLGRLLKPLLKTGLPLIGSALKLSAKRVLIPLGLTAAASATDAASHKRIFRSGMATLVISKEMNDIMKIVKSLEESGLLIKEVKETIKNEAKEQKGDISECS